MKQFIYAILMIIVFFNITSCNNNDDDEADASRPPLVMYNDEIYQTTGNEFDVTDEYEFVDTIKSVTKHNEKPTENLTGHLVKENSSIYIKTNDSDNIYIGNNETIIKFSKLN